MFQGAIIGNIDVAQLMVVAFVIFFVGLVLHLRREDKREGYPLKDPAGGPDAVGFPAMPRPKTFFLMEGGSVTAPHPEPPRRLAARRLFYFPGSPVVPTGDPLRDGVGPAAYALRKEAPMVYRPGVIQMAPLRVLPGWSIADGDPDPRGMTVVGADGVVAGVVRDLWIDRGVKIPRYFEVELDAGGRALLPIYHADISRKQRRVRVTAIRAAQFSEVPALRDADTITAREEDQINGFYAGAPFFRRAARNGETR